MKQRLLVLALMVLAAAAALAWRQTRESRAGLRLASLLPLPPPTITRAAADGGAPLRLPARGTTVVATVVAIAAVDPAADPGRAPAIARLAAPGEAVVEAAPPDRPFYPGEPRQLTQDACCPAAWWADDSQALHFLDRPPGAPQTAIYRQPLWPPGAVPAVLDLRQLGGAGPGRYVVRPAGDHSVVEDTTDGRTWDLPTGGNPAKVAPDGGRVVWWEARGGRDRDTTLSHVFGGRLDGTVVRDLGAFWGAEVVAFLPDSRRVLVKGRPAANQAVLTLATLDVDSGTLTAIAHGLWLSNALVSPDGAHVVYTTSLERSHPEDNGVWLASTEGGEPVKLPFEGAYRWRDADRLLYVPLQPGAVSHEVWQYQVSSGQAERLLDPAQVPIRIANNDWSVAPDGSALAWLAEEDRNIWLVDLP